MKKIFKTIVIIFFVSCRVFAIKDDTSLQNSTLNNEIIEQPIILQPEEIAPESSGNPYSKEALKVILTKEYDMNSTKGMFDEQLTFKINKGILENVGTQLNIYSTLTEEIPEKKKGNLNHNFKVINLALKGKFKGGKESFYILNDFTPYKDNFLQRLILDAYVESSRIPNHKLIIGTSRPHVGYEGGTSPYLIPLITRSQIARNLANVRKTGIRLVGDYKYIDYDIGGYSSDTFYTEFFPGVETDLWVNFKPLAKFEPQKVGTLNISGGYQTGKRNHHDFNVSSAAIRYDYKKLALMSEFQYANGSNGYAGLTEDKRWGYNTTLIYKLTKKLHMVARFDDFNNNVQIKKNNTREYTAGLNYYVLGNTLRFMLNYVYCQNMASPDTHKIILGSHILL